MRSAAVLLLLTTWLAGCGGAASVAPRADAPVDRPGPETAPDPPPPAPAKPVADAKPAPAGTPADTLAAAAPAVPEREVAVELGTDKRAELVVQARKDVVEAERLIAALAPSTDEERADKVRAVEGLVAQARTALEMDPDAAATLARKARLLAEEIAASR